MVPTAGPHRAPRGVEIDVATVLPTDRRRTEMHGPTVQEQNELTVAVGTAIWLIPLPHQRLPVRQSVSLSARSHAEAVNALAL